MHFVNFEIDPNSNFPGMSLGPFAKGLNAICGARSSGKTTISEFARSAFAPRTRTEIDREGRNLDRQNPYYSASKQQRRDLAGSILWQNENGQHECRVNHPAGLMIDSYPQYESSISVVSRFDGSYRYVDRHASSVHSDRIPTSTPVTDSDLEAIYFSNLGETATDRLWQAADRLGLLEQTVLTDDSERTRLLQEQRELKARIGSFNRPEHTQSWWRDERGRLVEELDAVLARPRASVQRPVLQRETVIANDPTLLAEIERLRKRESELIATINSIPAKPATAVRQQWTNHHTSQLKEIDARLNRWRETLREIKQQRQALEQTAIELRLERQLDVGYVIGENPHSSIANLEKRLADARNSFDLIADRFDDYRYEVAGRSPVRSEWTNTFASIQKDLHTVCQQLSRRESTSTADRLETQIQQLSRCEQELLLSIEKLIEERGVWIERMARELNVPVNDLRMAFGNWCQCDSHEHLYDWLISDEKTEQWFDRDSDSLPEFKSNERRRSQSLSSDSIDYDMNNAHVVHYEVMLEKVRSEIRRYENQIAQNAVHLEQGYVAKGFTTNHYAPVSEIRYATLAIDPTIEHKLREQIAECDDVLARWEALNRLEQRLAEVDAALVRKPIQTKYSTQPIVIAVNKYLQQLLGDPNVTMPVWAMPPSHRAAIGYQNDGRSTVGIYDQYSNNNYVTNDAGFGSANSSNLEHVVSVNDQRFSDVFHRECLELAIRMAIADAARPRIGSLPLVLDDPFRFHTGEAIHGESLDRIIQTLNRFAADYQQVILLTGSDEVSSRVQAHNGWVCHLTRHPVVSRYESAPAPYVAPTVSDFIPRHYDNDVNRHLQAVAYDYENRAWTDWVGSRHPTRAVTEKLSSQPASRFFLHVNSPIEDIPSMNRQTAAHLRSRKVYRVGEFLESSVDWLVDIPRHSHVYDANEMPSARYYDQLKSEADLMCHVPHLRGFDARVLVGCGIRTPRELREVQPTELLHRVESFLATTDGKNILRSGNSFELSRLTKWIASAKRNTIRTSRYDKHRGSADYYAAGRSNNGSYPPEGRNGYSRDRSERTSSDFFTVDRVGGQRSSNNSSTGRSRRTRTSSSSSIRSSSYPTSSSRSSPRASRISSFAGNATDWENRTDRRSEYGYTGSRRNSSERRYESLDSERQERERQQRDRRDRDRRDRDPSSNDREPRTRIVKISRTAKDSGSRRSSRRTSESDRSAARTRSERSRSGSISSRSSNRSNRESSRTTERVERLRFYLEIDSPVVDAPSIGPRMAEHLSKIGIYTVADLLQADPSVVASDLNKRRVTSETVTAWQHQSRLVCQIPNLRGHDAQLLVAADVTTPEELSSRSVTSLLPQITSIAESPEGQRYIRGGKEPDQAEVTDWINWSKQHRQLKAA